MRIEGYKDYLQTIEELFDVKRLVDKLMNFIPEG